MRAIQQCPRSSVLKLGAWTTFLDRLSGTSIDLTHWHTPRVLNPIIEVFMSTSISIWCSLALSHQSPLVAASRGVLTDNPELVKKYNSKVLKYYEQHNMVDCIGHLYSNYKQMAKAAIRDSLIRWDNDKGQFSKTTAQAFEFFFHDRKGNELSHFRLFMVSLDKVSYWYNSTVSDSHL
jgi:hypothetical protein